MAKNSLAPSRVRMKEFSCDSLLEAITDETVLKRFNSYFSKTDGCWLWTGCKANGYGDRGYGQLSVSFGGTRKMVLATRLSWMIHVGALDKSIDVLHRCDIPACINPAHLFLGTQKDNGMDMSKKGRSLSGEKNPKAKLTLEDTKTIRHLCNAERRTQKEVGDFFGVTAQCINNIVKGKTWAVTA